jgi:hypothetical protein
MDERPNLPPGLDRRFDERPRQLGGGDVLDRDAPAIDALERLDRRRREAAPVSVEFDGDLEDA